ncbi:helix-turn-helix domain-containing protein [Liquorilactobacillus sp.]|uniref:helix-turn-helix domain-containing protein n=1 Tax=Liquorilactobacillus sp. TaxID=2767923 RepID=UPI0039EC5B9A
MYSVNWFSICWNFGATRFVWNQMLEMQSKRYKNNKDSRFLNGFAMNFLLRKLKTEYSWLIHTQLDRDINTSKNILKLDLG